MDEPVQQWEILLLLLAAGVVVFAVTNRPRLRRLPAYRALLAAFYLMTAGWAFTNVEGILLHDLTNMLEHLCYASGSVVLAVWCWRALTPPKTGRT